MDLNIEISPSNIKTFIKNGNSFLMHVDVTVSGFSLDQFKDYEKQFYALLYYSKSITLIECEKGVLEALQALEMNVSITEIETVVIRKSPIVAKGITSKNYSKISIDQEPTEETEVPATEGTEVPALVCVSNDSLLNGGKATSKNERGP